MSKTQTNVVVLAKERTLWERFRLNALSHIYAQFITIFSQLAVVPFFLKNWGAPTYAEWLVLASLPNILVLLDFGISQASSNAAIIASAKHTTEHAKAPLQTAFVFTLIVCIVLLFGANAVSIQFDLTHIFRLNEISRADANTTFIFLILYLCANMLGGNIDAWFRVYDRTALGGFLFANRRLVDICVTIGVLSFDGSPETLAIYLAISQFVVLLGIIFLLVYLHGSKNLGFRHASLQEFKVLFWPSTAYLGFPLAQAVTLQGGIQMLHAVADPNTLVAYSMARTLMRLVIQLGVISNNALKPELSRLIGLGRSAQARAFTRRSSVIVSTISILCFGILTAFSTNILNIWSQGLVHLDRTSAFLIGIHAVINVLWYIPASFLIASNRHTLIAPAYCASSIITIMFWFFMQDSFDPLIGASLLLAIPEITTLLILVFQIKIKA